MCILIFSCLSFYTYYLHRHLRHSLEAEQAKTTKNIAESEQLIEAYSNNEKELEADIVEQEKTVASLTKEKDGLTKQIEALQLEVEVLSSKIKDTQDLEASNANLKKELDNIDSTFDKERSAMAKQVTVAEEKVGALEKELDTKRKLVHTAEKALEETSANLVNVQGQYDKEVQAVKDLQGELQGMTAKLADLEASNLKATAQQEEAAAKQIAALQAQVDTLTTKLKEATNSAAKSEQKLKDYESRVESMQGTLMQSSTNVEARENDLTTLKNELEAVKVKADAALAKQVKKSEELQLELNRTKKQMSDSLAEANVEITQRGQVLERKERELTEVSAQYKDLVAQVDNVNASAKEKLTAQAEDLRKMEVKLKSESQEKGALANEIAKLKKDIAVSTDGAEKTVNAQNSEMKKMEQVRFVLSDFYHNEYFLLWVSLGH